MVILSIASFGTSKIGLAAIVGYRPKSAAGAWLAVRQTAGVTEIGSGMYEVSYDAPDGAVAIQWDSGEIPPRYYVDDAPIITAIKDKTDQLTFTVANKVDASTSDTVVNVTVAPLQTSIVYPTFTINGGTVLNLEIPQNGSSSWLFVVTDSEGDLVDLSGKTIRLVVHDYYGAARFAVTSGSSEGGTITISGASSNQLTVEVTEDSTASAFAGEYKLWNVTDRDVLASGKFTIKTAPLTV